jgi:carboxypeptidase Q
MRTSLLASVGAALIALPLAGVAQTALPVAAELRAIAHEEEAVMENAFHLIDRIGGRISGQSSGDSAQAFVERTLAGYGLDRVWREPFPLLGWDRGDARLEVVAPADLAGRALNVLSLGQVGSATATAPVVDAGFGTDGEIAALGETARGAFLLVRVGQPEGYGRSVHRTEKISLAADAGAAGFIMVAPRPGTVIQVGVATLGDEPSPIPAVGADFESGEWLARMVGRSAEPLRLSLVLDNWMERTSAENVLAEIRGTGDEVVLVGAHLDSWDLGTGALDNGSGSLAVLETARILAEHVRRTGERPRRTIRFALWMGEELGLYGSRHHVEERLGDLDRYRAVLNLDMVGAPAGLGVMGREEGNPLLHAVLADLADAGLALDDELGRGGGLYSDHHPFLLEGIPILTMRTTWAEGSGAFYHSAGDTRDKLDEPGIRETAAVAAALLLHAAAADPFPWERWEAAETGRRLEALNLRDPLERAGEWRWD